MSDKYVSKLKLKDNTTVTIKDENAYTKEQVDNLLAIIWLKNYHLKQ